jgi:redox-sensitive bicupin YhaK (pirin superfamily)
MLITVTAARVSPGRVAGWVMSGSLVHHDSEGNKGLVCPDLTQRVGAGTGIRNSEKNTMSI